MTHGPEPGTILNESGEPTVPRQAATVIVLRGGAERLEVLMVQRTPKARFMGGAWVFPGGAVDAHEGEGDAPHRAAAVREVAEEVADRAARPGGAGPVRALDHAARGHRSASTPTSSSPSRPTAPRPIPDGQEIVDARWFEPARALEGSEAGELLMVFPTIKNLEVLARFDTADALLEWASTHEVRPVQPRVEGQGETARIVLDDE